MSTRLSPPFHGGIRLMAKVAIAAVLIVTTVGIGATAQAAPPTCNTPYGSLPKSAGATATGAINGVRTGRHRCFDRLVVDLDGDTTGYRVDYVDAVYADGSGELVPVKGGAILNIVLFAPAYDDTGRATVDPATVSATNVAGYRTLRDVEWAGSFEGQTTLGLGVRARLPFRVFTLDGPGDGSRLVVDVAHRWTPTAGEEPSTNLPGRPVDGFVQTGDSLAVIGVAYDDRLNIRSAPGINQRIVARVSSDTVNLVASGRARALTRSVWYEVTIDGVTGWASSTYLGVPGNTHDPTSSFRDSAPVGVSMSELGRYIAEEYGADQPSARIVRSGAPSVGGDVSDVMFDITGFSDDSIAAVRIHVFATPHDSGDGFVLKAVEATTFCQRGVDTFGLCI